MLSHVARPSGTQVLYTLCFPGSEITLEMVALAASLTDHMMGIAAESYLGSIRWLITEEQQLWIQTQKEWHIDKIFGGRTIRLMPDLMWRETAYWKVILKMKKVQK